MVKSLVIAGTQSGVGKTTLVIGLIASLRERGLSVQPFKVGPDYIDAAHHTRVAGRTCRNLDTWMIPVSRTKALFEHVAQGSDIALIEGVMGLFDGVGYDDETGSTAQVAKLLDSPVLVVIDASKMARSSAALARGFQSFDDAVRVVGFLINRVGSERHGEGVASAVTAATGLPVLGWVPREEALQIPERHLGLIPSSEPGRWDELMHAAGKAVAKYVNLESLLELAGTYPLPPAQQASSGNMGDASRVVIAVARDEAFHFCYQENLSLLEDAGAAIRLFSPLHDDRLPEGTAGVLLSGGFPEVYAEVLSRNRSMHDAMRQAHARELPIYAECGGLMYLTEAITDFEGRRFPMVGVLAGHSVMTRRLSLGYRQATALSSSWLFAANEGVRGHEFHYSNWHDRPATLPAAYALTPRDGMGPPVLEGARLGNLWASYVHLHFWGKPELAQRFVKACCSTSRNR